MYAANLDYINAVLLSDNGGNSKDGCSVYEERITTFSTGRLVFTGWAIVDGGVQDYVWSMDGGKTWTVINASPGNDVGDAHYNVVQKRIGEYRFSEGSNIRSTFPGHASQGENISGLGIDLSAYAGETVEIIFAAVPIEEPNTLCLIARLTNVAVTVE